MYTGEHRRESNANRGVYTGVYRKRRLQKVSRGAHRVYTARRSNTSESALRCSRQCSLSVVAMTLSNNIGLNEPSFCVCRLAIRSASAGLATTTYRKGNHYYLNKYLKVAITRNKALAPNSGPSQCHLISAGCCGRHDLIVQLVTAPWVSER